MADAPLTFAEATLFELTLIMPILNDWPTCAILLQRIDGIALPTVGHLRVLIVDDGSSTPVPAGEDLTFRRITEVLVLDLACNLGHQRAIALGLAWVARDYPHSRVVVMDSDGEDDPADIPRLVAALEGAPGAIIVAGRTQRSEGMRFRVGYAAYQLLFRLLVGRQIDFGNFCAFGPAVVQRLARTSDTWNHLAATLLRARVAVVRVPTRRGSRYAGRSSMNLPALIAHGLSAFAVFSDYVFARLLLFASALCGLVLVGGLIVVGIRLFTRLATPGWASTVLGAFSILFVQAILICLIAAVQMLATRSQPGAQPAMLLEMFVRRVRILAGPAGQAAP
jgi:glycosyltransferase involved in cell wall biosynthesis